MVAVFQLVRDPVSLIAAIGLGILSIAAPAGAEQPPSSAAAQRDGQHDFDWEFGTWATHVRVLRNPLSGAPPEWVEFSGTSVVRPLLDGRSNSVELSVKNPKGQIEGIALRLYNPKTRQWNVNYASLGNGMLTPAIYGGFDGKGRGTFYGQDTLDGRAILVRFIITVASAGEARFEQAYSADGGANWETNWIAVDKRQSQ